MTAVIVFSGLNGAEEDGMKYNPKTIQSLVVLLMIPAS